MFLTEKQKLFLFALLQNTLEKNVIGYLKSTHETRKTLLNNIINQQLDKEE